MSRRIPLLVPAALAFMALVLAVLWLAPGPAASWRRWQPPPPQPPNLDDALAAVLRINPAADAAYPTVLARPLLDPSRRPQPTSASSLAAAPPPIAIEQVTMQGIVNGPTLTGVFLQEAGQGRFVRRGEKVGDWTLEGIDGGKIVFRRGSEQRKIELLPLQEQGNNKTQDQGSKSNAALVRPHAPAVAPPAPPPPRPAPTAGPGPKPAGVAAEPASAPLGARGAFGGGRRTPPPPVNDGAAPR
ncbi:hypothetical protein [Ottowia sp.]|uniref:hypothetical protein n=1 Tax=Ottowia sp. TaxID=1898956 RepID=UPI0026137036|nr:hypothetical protein [Ottowia sp.]